MSTPTRAEARDAAFKADMRKGIAETILKLKRGGTVAMGADNLFAVSVGKWSRSQHAPSGVNCGWVARQVFNEVIREPGFMRFIIQ
jgi:hypothetical protein